MNNYILQQQEPMKAKYAEKIRKMNMKEDHFRRRGMGNYSNYDSYDNEDDEEFMYHYPWYDNYRRNGRYTY